MVTVNKQLERVSHQKPTDFQLARRQEFLGQLERGADLFADVMSDLAVHWRSGRTPQHEADRRHGISNAAASLELTSVYDQRSVGSPDRSRPRDASRTDDNVLRFERNHKIKDVIPLSDGAKKARDEYVKVLEKRFGKDSDDYKRAMALLPKMEQTILHQKTKTEGGRAEIDPQKELTQVYKDLTELGSSGKAERRTYIDENGVEKRIRTKEDVDRLLVGTMNRLADQRRMHNQGDKNSCASQSIMRQCSAVTASTYTRLMLDAATKGEVDGRDLHGNPIKIKIDDCSARPDHQAQHFSWDPKNRRDYAGQMSDLIAGSTSATLFGLRNGGDPNRYVYRQDAVPTSGSSTGEHFIDTWTGRELGQHPMMTPRQISDVKQCLFGYRISDDYGKNTTLVGRPFRNVSNVTCCLDGSDFQKRVQENEAKGWTYSTVITHTKHYHGLARGQGGAGDAYEGGLHATSVTDGGRTFVNNWGGIASFENVDPDRLVAWMDIPQRGSSPQPDRVTPRPDGDHRLYILPDGQRRDKQLVADREKLNKPDDRQRDPADKQKNEHAKKVSQDQIAVFAKQIYDANAQLSELRNILASLSNADDPRRQAIVAQKDALQDKLLDRKSTRLNSSHRL